MATRKRARKVTRAATPPPADPAEEKRDAGPAERSETTGAPDADGLMQLLTLFVGQSEYAVPVLNVREIASYGTVTPVPMTPAWIRGVMNLRGTVVPVIDLAAKLGMAPSTITRRSCLIIVEATFDADKLVMAVVVDGVSRVIDIPPSELQEAPSFGTEVSVELIRGILRIDERLVMLLDIERVLSAGDVLKLGAIEIEPGAEAVEMGTAAGVA